MSQQPLDLRTADGARLTFRRPMLGMESVRALTGLSEDEVLAEIEAGKILWAWNLAGARADARMYVRVWNRSVICWEKPELSQPADLDELLPSILPHSRSALRCSDLMRACNVSSQHILNLVDARLLARVPGDVGPKESPYVTRASVIELLQARRLT